VTNDEPRPDYGELMKSPYDPDQKPGAQRSENGSELSWKPAVVAAALGAFVVSAFVIYAIVSSPDEPLDAAPVDSAASTTEALDAVQSLSLPEGFTMVTDTVGARVEAVDVSARATALSVSTAVPGGDDPGEVPPLDAAYWELVLQDGPRRMTAQYQGRGALGSITVGFPPLAALREPKLVPYLEVGADEVVATVDLDPGVPTSLDGYEIDVGDGRFVDIESLVIGDGWGHVAWSARGGPAKVETVVRFVGTDDPATPEVSDETLLTPPHLQALAQGAGVVPLPPLYGFTGSEQLIRSGEPLGASNEAEAIVVEFRVVMPREVVEGSAIDVPTGG